MSSKHDNLFFLDADPARERNYIDLAFHIRFCEINADLLKATVLLFKYIWLDDGLYIEVFLV
jgi:hypothetical protein